MKKTFIIKKGDSWDMHFGDSETFENMLAMIEAPYKRDGDLLNEAPYDYKITIIRKKIIKVKK